MKGMGDLGGARALLQRATERSPKHSPSWQAWGMLEAECGNVQKARQVFQQGVWACPKGGNTVRILQSWAILEAREGRPVEARRYFRYALEADPTSVPVLVAWALMEEQAGDAPRARELFEVAVSVERGANVHVWNAYEAFELRCGGGTAARDVYERGLVASTPRTGPARLSALGATTRGSAAAKAAVAAAAAAAGAVQGRPPSGRVVGRQGGSGTGSSGLEDWEGEFSTVFGETLWSNDFMDFRYERG